MHEEFVKYLKHYSPEEVIIQEGEDTLHFFCLLQGKVGIWKGDKEERKKFIKIGEISEKGIYFGEMGCLLQEKRSATIVAVDEVKVLKFPSEMLSQMMLKQPKLGIKLCSEIAQRLKGATGKQTNVTVERNEIRDIATEKNLSAKSNFQKIFVMLTALQTQLQNPMLKTLIEYMSRDSTLLKGGRKIRFDEGYFEDMPDQIAELAKKAYADKIT